MDTGLVSSAAPPRIFVTVPGVEDLESVIVLLRAAGAEITDQHREFVIQGPLTPQRAVAVWRLSQHREMSTRRPARVTPAAEREPVSSTKTEAVYCGQGGAWAPPPGRPVAIGCMLCPRSPTYRRYRDELR